MEDLPEELREQLDSRAMQSEHDPLAWTPSSIKPGWQIVAGCEAVTAQAAAAEFPPDPKSEMGKSWRQRLGHRVLQAMQAFAYNIPNTTGLAAANTDLFWEAAPAAKLAQPADAELEHYLKRHYERQRTSIMQLYKSAEDTTSSRHRLWMDDKDMYVTADVFSDPTHTYFAIYEAPASTPVQPAFIIKEYAGFWDGERTSSFPYRPVATYDLHRHGDDFIMNCGDAGNKRIGNPDLIEEMTEIIDEALEVSEEGND